ncbi:MAG: DinB family protein [Thermoanaerobaculia bacterium]|nr:DinB family protein [Thermoanaerobaculia bacterium]
MPVSTVRPSQTAALADQLERAFRGGAWHGPSVLEALDGVDAVLAARRPIGSAHTIGEIVLHLTAWIDVARRRIAGEAIAALPDEADWPAAGGEEAAWRTARERLDDAHARLHAAALELDDERLDDPVAGSDPTVRGQLLGVLQHNVYHAGQIVLLRRAAGDSR